jgi:RNA polymerase sigma factor (sigma-70 family)
MSASPELQEPELEGSAALVPTDTVTEADRSQITARLLAQIAETTDEVEQKRLRDEIVVLNMGVARAIASRYRDRGIARDDLLQAAYVGLVKAVQGFDPTFERDFLSYAVPTVTGEVKRYFRDFGWTVRPPRRIQELQAQISRASNELSQSLHRSPKPREVAEFLGIDVDSVIEALAADGCFTPASLDVPVGEDGVGGKVLRHLAEVRLEAGLAAGSADAGLGVADDAGGPVHHARGNERRDGEVGGGRVAARIGDEAGARDTVAAVFGQSVHRFGQQFGLGVALLVPGGVILRRAEPESAAEIDHTRAGAEHGRSEFHGNFGRGGQEYDGQTLGADCLGGARKVRVALLRGRVFAMLQQYGADAGVPLEEVNEFGAAIAPVADNTYG